MTDELKAELAQLAEENRRLRESIESMKPFLLEIQTHEFNRKYPGKTMYGFNGQNLTFDQMNQLLETLQTPPTPGLGAAMLRVVESVKEIVLDDVQRAGGFEYLINKIQNGASWMCDDMIPVVSAVKALNELENQK